MFRCFPNEYWGSKQQDIYQDSILYHDNSWGRITNNTQNLFEALVLETQQAGLSWNLILKKRKYYKKVFDDFNPYSIQFFTDKKIQQIMNDKNNGIIKNILKIRSIVNNSQCFIKLLKEYKTIYNYILQFVPQNMPYSNQFQSWNDLPTSTPWSKQLAKDMKKRGFSFVGPISMYDYCQAIGIVNDHLNTCFCYSQCQKLQKKFIKQMR